MAERSATISAHRQVLREMLLKAADTLESTGDAMMIVPGDDGPGLALTFSAEPDSYPEFAEPSVDFS